MTKRKACNRKVIKGYDKCKERSEIREEREREKEDREVMDKRECDQGEVSTRKVIKGYDECKETSEIEQ